MKVRVHVATPASLQAIQSNNHKQIIQIKNYTIKNPKLTGGKTDQLAIYKRGRGVELKTTEKQIQLVARAGLGTQELRIARVRRADHSAKLSPFFVFPKGHLMFCLLYRR